MKQTNFDRHLKEQLDDPAFARRFERAGQVWDVALQIAALRSASRALAKRIGAAREDDATANLSTRIPRL